jgi:hypothetical protein
LGTRYLIAAGREEDRIFSTQELGELVLELPVNILRATDEANRGHAVPTRLQPLVRGPDHLRMAGKAQIVVGANIDALAQAGADRKLDFDFRRLWRSDVAFILEQAGGLDALDFVLIPRAC